MSAEEHSCRTNSATDNKNPLLKLKELERIFLFIDETGDPGHPNQRDASSFYQINIVVAVRSGIRNMVEHFSRFRYFCDANKEFEKYLPKEMDKIRDLFVLCSQHPGILFFSFYLNKKDYKGPYMNGSGKYSYDPKKFRNFVVRMALEKVCLQILSSTIDDFSTLPEIELVFDRYLSGEDDESNLKQYLRGNYKLPKFLHIVQVDSEYSDLIQISDLLGKLVKKSVFDGANDPLDYAHVYYLESPDSLVKRG